MAREMFVWEEEIEELTAENTRLRAEVERYKAFVVEYDAYAKWRGIARLSNAWPIHPVVERLIASRAALPAAADDGGA